MYDLPPSAFVRSAPCDPRRHRAPAYVTFGLALAVGASGIIGYSAGHASDTLTMGSFEGCQAVPAAARSGR